MDTLNTQLTDPGIVAFQRLLQLNLELWRPEVAEWLHSEEAEPVLKELLTYVPCPAYLH